MKKNSNFNPVEWAKQENAPQKSTVKNQTPAAAPGDWAPTDDYAQACEVVERIVQAGANIGEDYNDYLKVNFAFASAFGEAGRELAEKVCGMSTKFEKKEFDKKYDNCLRSSHNAITIATFYQMAKDAGIATLANMIIVGHLLENHPELSFFGTDEVVEKLVPAKKAALKELNMKALNLGKSYNK